MADNEIRVTLTATDNISPTLDKVAASSSKTSDVITTGLGVALGNVLTKALDAAGQAFERVVKVMTDAFNEAQASELINVKLAKAIDNTGRQIVANVDAADALAQKYRDLAGGEDDTVKSAETILLRFKEIGRDTFPQALQVSADLAAAMGTDMASAAETLGRALENPAAGMRMLRQVGVNFNSEELKVIENLMNTGRAAEAQSIIMATLSGTVGGMAAAAANTMAGKWSILTNHLNDAVKSIAEKLLPIIERLFNQYIMPNIPVIERFADAFGTDIVNAVNWMVTSIESMIPVLSAAWDGIVAIVSTAANLIMQVWTTMNNAIFIALISLWQSVSQIFGGIFQTIFSSIFGISQTTERGMEDTKLTMVEKIMAAKWAVLTEIAHIKFGFETFFGQLPNYINMWLRQAGDFINQRLDDFRRFFQVLAWDVNLIWQKFMLGMYYGFIQFYNDLDPWLRRLIELFTGIRNSSDPFGVRAQLEYNATGQIYNPFVGARAAGGPVMPGQPYMVGERGPEPFIPKQAGMVLPNVTNYNYNASYNTAPGNDPVASFALMKAMVSQ